MQLIHSCCGKHSNLILFHRLNHFLEHAGQDVIIKSQTKQSWILEMFLTLFKSKDFIILLLLNWNHAVLRVVREDLFTVDFNFETD